MINDLKERILEQANVAKDRMKLEKRHHRNMIFEAALIAVFARHPSNHGLLSESTDFFRNQYSLHYDFSKASDLEFQMFFRYYWTMRVAAPLFFISKNQGHSLRLLPRLVEAKNVDYQYGGKSSQAVKFRIKIFTVELDRWRYYTHGFNVSLAPPSTAIQVAPIMGKVTITSPRSYEPTPMGSVVVAPSSSTLIKELPAQPEKRQRVEEPVNSSSATTIVAIASSKPEIMSAPLSVFEFRKLYGQPSAKPATEAHDTDKVLEYALDWMEIMNNVWFEETEVYLSMERIPNTMDETRLALYPKNMLNYKVCSVILEADKFMKNAARGIYYNNLNKYNLVDVSPKDYKRYSLDVEGNLWLVPIGYVYLNQDKTMKTFDLSFEVRCLEAYNPDDPNDMSSKIRRQRTEVPAFIQPFIRSFNQHINEMLRQEDCFKELYDCYLGFAKVCLRDHKDKWDLTTSRADKGLSSLINTIRSEKSGGCYFSWELLIENSHDEVDDAFYANDRVLNQHSAKVGNLVKTSLVEITDNNVYYVNQQKDVCSPPPMDPIESDDGCETDSEDEDDKIVKQF
jgi:hypothetical protein